MAFRGNRRLGDFSQDIIRPQSGFLDKVDNHGPFLPKLPKKPNALPGNPLPKALLEYGSEQGVVPSVVDDCIFEHPYKKELEALEFSEKLNEKLIPQDFTPFPSLPCEVISSKKDFLSMVRKLKECEELAVDLEGHTYRSFQGFTCLVQISTRTEDFLIDAFALRSQMFRLNKVFTNPKVVKVFHGAQQDIEWLQRDFGVYVVNMFDTAVAARTAGHWKSSLDYLMSTYCGVESKEKREMQLADWRVRPIPIKMRRYAQKDTHYLLYIYDILRNELIDLNDSKILSGFNESRKTCLRKYQKPTSNGFIEKNQNKLDCKRRELLRLLSDWRDRTARDVDESTGYVMPNNMLLDVVRDMPGNVARFFPPDRLEKHPLIRQHAQQIQGFLKQARQFDSPAGSINGSKKSKNKPRKRKYFSENTDEECTTLKKKAS